MTSLTATIGIWFVTLLWGSWFQTVKHLKNFPVDVFISIMYAISVGIVWLSILIFGNSMIPNGISYEVSSNPVLSITIVICGFIFGIAMQLHLKIVKRIGLILSASVSATCAILGGTLVSILYAGVPQGVSVSLIVFASLLLVGATITCQYAGYRCDHDRGYGNKRNETSRLKDVLQLAFVNLCLMSSYPLANSLGLRTPLHTEGFSSLTCMGLLVVGAFIGAMLITLWHPHRRYLELLKTSGISNQMVFLLALIAALCHFGGNILHAIFAPVVSITIATAMGNSYHVWSYVWGLLYGEFKGATLKTYVILGSGVLMFLAGVFVLSVNSV